MTPGVSIVIPTWNGLDLLERFLPSVIAAAEQYRATKNARVEIVVVDDGSNDQSVEWLSACGFSDHPEPPPDSGSPAHDLSRRLVVSVTNSGFGEACNRGFEAAAQPLVFLLNNDVEPDLNSIAPLVENFGDPSVFAVHCRVFDLKTGQQCGTGKLGSFERGFIRVHRSYAPLTAEAGRESVDLRTGLYSMFAGGGSAMFDRPKFLEMGGFDSLLSPFYWEDVELSYRAWKRGYKVMYEPRSVTAHDLSSTIGKLNARYVRKIEQRNRLIYHWVHLHGRWMIVSHALWVTTLAVTAPLRLEPEFISSCVAALKLLPSIRKRRLEELRAARLSDRDVFEVFASMEKRGDLFAYDERDDKSLPSLHG